MLVGLLCAVSACVAQNPSPTDFAPAVLTQPTDDLSPSSLAQAAQRTASHWTKRDSSEAAGSALASSRDLSQSAQWLSSVLAAEPPDAATTQILRRCRAYRATRPAKITAYFEPVLRARRQSDDTYRYPLYRKPDAAVVAEVEHELGRSLTRADIDGRGALGGRGLELVWTDDPVARFFLHVQGSGRLLFEDGTVLRAGYAGNNGAPYRSVGSVLLERGILAKGAASAPAIRAWLAQHPDQRDEILFENPRYIYFALAELDPDQSEGPVGSLGVALVAGRSVATDPAHIPPGALLYIRSRRPLLDEQGALQGWEPLGRFVFSHDTGAAIQGPARVDIFWGTGERAGTEAGYMNETGELFLIDCNRRPHRPGQVPWRR